MKRELRFAAHLFLLCLLCLPFCKKENDCDDCLPVAKAGADQVILLPTDSVLLDGSGSLARSGGTLRYQWNKLDGPASFFMVTPDQARTMVRNLVEGAYTFRLTVTDRGGRVAQTSIRVTVTYSTASDTCNGYWVCVEPTGFASVSYSDGFASSAAFGATVSIGNRLFFAGGHKDDLMMGEASHHVYVYNDDDPSWKELSLSTPRIRLAGVAAGGKVLFAGGRNSICTYCPQAQYYDVVDLFDAGSYLRTTARLSEARSYLASAGDGTRAFFIGGETPVGYSKKMDVYDAPTNTWSVVDLPRARAYAGAAVLNNKLYIGGGKNETGALEVIDVYDIGARTWSELRSPNVHARASVVALNGKLLLAGGDGTGQGFLDIFNTADHTWKVLPMSDGRYDMATAVAQNKVIFLGGNYSSRIDTYNDDTGTLTSSGLNQGVSGVMSGSVNGKCLFSGFLYEHGMAVTNALVTIRP
jgi:hypothetical protein